MNGCSLKDNFSAVLNNCVRLECRGRVKVRSSGVHCTATSLAILYSGGIGQLIIDKIFKVKMRVNKIDLGQKCANNLSILVAC